MKVADLAHQRDTDSEARTTQRDLLSCFELAIMNLALVLSVSETFFSLP